MKWIGAASVLAGLLWLADAFLRAGSIAIVETPGGVLLIAGIVVLIFSSGRSARSDAGAGQTPSGHSVARNGSVKIKVVDL